MTDKPAPTADAPSSVVPWLDAPYCAGWWLWMEDGDDKPEKLLVDGSEGSWHVAYDDELGRALGREIDEDENYWEGTDCTQEYMPGKWQIVERARVRPATAEQVDVEAIAREIAGDSDIANGGYGWRVSRIGDILRRHLQVAGGVLGGIHGTCDQGGCNKPANRIVDGLPACDECPSQPATDPPALRCFTDHDDDVWAMTSENVGLYFCASHPDVVIETKAVTSRLERRYREIPFPAALALLADRPEQQARLAEMNGGQS